MSTTIQGVDARGYLAGWLNALVGMYSADVNAIPDEKWNENLGGCTRPASELTADAMSLLGWTTEALKGNVIESSEEGMSAQLKTACATKASAIAKMQEASAELAQAIKDASDETLNKVVKAPFGMEMPLFMLAQIAVSHIWYHDGQLNYIHCLLGDSKIYWMG